MSTRTKAESGAAMLAAVPIAQAQQWADSSQQTLRGSVCIKCMAPIMWAKHHATGNLMPLNKQRDHSGKIYFVGYERVAIVLKNEEISPEIPRFKSHFATCPFAPEFRV